MAAKGATSLSQQSLQQSFVMHGLELLMLEGFYMLSISLLRVTRLLSDLDSGGYVVGGVALLFRDIATLYWIVQILLSIMCIGKQIM